MSQIRRYYWDSSVFCSYFNQEPGRADIVDDLLQEAVAGKSEIITSSFSLVEVVKLKNTTPITAKQEEQLEAFFEYPCIKIVNADRGVCERARQLVWKYGLKPKDAVHVATAEFAAKIVIIHELFSWDSDFTKLNGKIPTIPFDLREPYMKQPLLKLEDVDAPPPEDGGR